MSVPASKFMKIMGCVCYSISSRVMLIWLFDTYKQTNNFDWVIFQLRIHLAKQDSGSKRVAIKPEMEWNGTGQSTRNILFNRLCTILNCHTVARILLELVC